MRFLPGLPFFSFRQIHSPPSLIEEVMEYKIEAKNKEKLIPTRIPSYIHKTFKTNIVSPAMKKAIYSWLQLNPEYTLCFYDNEEAENLIRDYFPPEVLEAYHLLRPGAYKADLFRFCVLYHYGGIYSDIGQVCLQPLSSIIHPEDEFITAKDIPLGALQISFMASIPKHPFLAEAIRTIVANVKSRYYGESCLDITGPIMFGAVVNKLRGRKIREPFELGGDHRLKLGLFTSAPHFITFDNKPILKCRYDGYDEDRNRLSGPPYGLYWNERKVYHENATIPPYLHLIYIPWYNKSCKLKENPYDFDRSFYYQLQRAQGGIDVKLWTLPKITRFLQRYYKQDQELILTLPCPIMMVDIMRLLLVHHYGGIYWQYGSINKVPFDRFFPSKGKEVKLFTETILTEDQVKASLKYPIRKGIPEEKIRILFGVFSASPGASFLKQTIEFLFSRLKGCHVNEDYDILYLTGNAMFSTAYDKYGRTNDKVELTSLAHTKEMIDIKSNGSWRRDKT